MSEEKGDKSVHPGPLRISILALGSRGDVFPIAILGQALQAAGHQVTLATFEGFEEMVRGMGLIFHPVQGDAESLLTGSAGIDLAESGRNILRSWQAVMQSFGAIARGYARDFGPLVERPTDLIINQLPIGLFGSDLAEKLNVPMIAAAVIPMTRTAAFPMLAFPDLFSFLPGYNRLTYRLAEQLVWHGFRKTINPWRQQTLHLPPLPWKGTIGKIHGQPVPVINGFSPHVVPRPADWGKLIHITGYWFAAEPEWQPAPELLRFLEAGAPPVFVGFGSMPVRHPERLTHLILEALRLSGQRAILHTGWAGLQADDMPPYIYSLEYAPYGWLFPQMAAIVHHGGSGTTHFGLRSGVPSMVVPFLFDQFYWGRRIQKLGVGLKPLPFKRLQAEQLAAAINQMVNDSAMRRQAAALGKMIQAENGLAQAVAAVEACVSRRSPAR
jgi:sterol 3beta-glucosyltransferase